MQAQEDPQEQLHQVEWPRLQKLSQHPLPKQLEALLEGLQWLLMQVQHLEDHQQHLVPAEGAVGLL
jgi:hypothetical protein